MPRIERLGGILFYRRLSVCPYVCPSVCLHNLTFSHYSLTNLLTRLIFGMKAYLINMHLLVPRSRSFAKVKVKYKGYISQKMAVSGGIRVSQTHLIYISVITEYIYLKLRVCVHYPKSNPYYQERQSKMHFLQNYAPSSTWIFFILLASTPQLSIVPPCNTLVLLFPHFFYPFQK